MTRINVCYHPCQISNCTNARPPRCPAVSSRHVGVRLRWRRSPPASWIDNEEALKGSGDVKHTPQRLEGPKTYAWQKVTPALNMARIWYPCYYVKFLGCKSWICVSSKLDFLEHILPNGGFDVDIFLHVFMKQSNMKLIFVDIFTLTLPNLPQSRKFQPKLPCHLGSKRENSFFHPLASSH